MKDIEEIKARLTEKNQSFLTAFNINIDEYKEIDVLLESIDDAIVDEIVSHNDEITDNGIELQKIYDLIAFN